MLPWTTGPILADSNALKRCADLLGPVRLAQHRPIRSSARKLERARTDNPKRDRRGNGRRKLEAHIRGGHIPTYEIDSLPSQQRPNHITRFTEQGQRGIDTFSELGHPRLHAVSQSTGDPPGVQTIERCPLHRQGCGMAKRGGSDAMPNDHIVGVLQNRGHLADPSSERQIFHHPQLIEVRSKRNRMAHHPLWCDVSTDHCAERKRTAYHSINATSLERFAPRRAGQSMSTLRPVWS